VHATLAGALALGVLGLDAGGSVAVVIVLAIGAATLRHRSA